MASTWDLWFPDVLVNATMAPDPLVRQAVCRAAREFLRTTKAWVEWLDASATVAGTGVEYDFDIPPQAELFRVDQATLNGTPLGVQSFRARNKDWTTDESSKSLISRDQVTYTLVGLFSAGDVVQVQATLIPTLKATGLPDFLANRYFEPIAEGAKAIVLMTLDTEFYKPDLAGMCRAKFVSAMNTHAVDAYLGHTTSVPRARPKWC